MKRVNYIHVAAMLAPFLVALVAVVLVLAYLPEIKSGLSLSRRTAGALIVFVPILPIAVLCGTIWYYVQRYPSGQFLALPSKEQAARMRQVRRLCFGLPIAMTVAALLILVAK